MYIRSSQWPKSDHDVLEVMQRHMFAMMVTASADGLVATHLPFVIDAGRGERGTLFAHMAQANPQSALIGSDEDTLVVFSGPHGYISPSWYRDRATAPTWNYIAVHCYGRTRRHSNEEARENIERLLEVVEDSGETRWSMAELSGAETAQLLQNVVSFEMPIRRLEAKFKLNQGETQDRTAAAIVELERRQSSELAGYMRRYNDL
jgi:transcriptional regulator